VALLLAADAVLAWGQIRRPPLQSGSASVMLIARVESLSVVANSETAAAPVVVGEPAAGMHPVSITTSWAVPANFTTFRLSQYFGGQGAIPALPKDGSRAMPGQGRPSGGEDAVLVVDSGETNQAKTRTDLLDAGVSLGAAGGPGRGEGSGLLNILVQAL